MTVFVSIILAVVVAGAIATANMLFKTSEKESSEVTIWGSIPSAILPAVVICLINIFSPAVIRGGAAWLGWIFLAAMIGIGVIVILWWHENGSCLKEMIPFGVIILISFFVSQSAATAATATFNNRFWESVIMYIPVLMLILSVGLIVIDWLRFKAEMAEERAKREREDKMKALDEVEEV